MLRLLPFLAVALPAALHAQSAPAAADAAPVELGHGRHTYRWIAGFATLPDGSELGNTHGCVAVDSRGRIYFNTETPRSRGGRPPLLVPAAGERPIGGG